MGNVRKVKRKLPPECRPENIQRTAESLKEDMAKGGKIRRQAIRRLRRVALNIYHNFVAVYDARAKDEYVKMLGKPGYKPSMIDQLAWAKLADPYSWG
jgi:hypothetical protein